MPPAYVDQLLPDGSTVLAPDDRLTTAEKVLVLKLALPGAETVPLAGVPAIRFKDKAILFKQVTYLGHPWEPFKKRIQIPHTWIAAEAAGREAGLDVRFMGIYRHGDVTVLVDFDPETYVRRKANNSAAHVWTNDLYQALTLGSFSREDSRGNRLTSVRADRLEAYLAGLLDSEPPAVRVLRDFNELMLSRGRIEALDAIQQMYDAGWPDRFQGEWPGFYLEFCLDRFTRDSGADRWVRFQKVKRKGSFDYDLVLHEADASEFFGDLKASNEDSDEAPGNDAADLRRCVEEFGRFWYVVYEHQTWHARHNHDEATIAWNEWRWSVGHRGRRKDVLDPLSYAARFKEAVDFNRMFVLEVNPANIDVVLGEFHQGHQPGGASRAVKVMIKKTNIENFQVYSEKRVLDA